MPKRKPGEDHEDGKAKLVKVEEKNEIKAKPHSAFYISRAKDCPSRHKYIPGFGGEHQSEALKDALPKVQSTPQVCPYGLYAEQLSGTSFTTPRSGNQRTWLYRIRPAVVHSAFKRYEGPMKGKIVASFGDQKAVPNQFRWKPFPLPDAKDKVDFVHGLHTLGGAGASELKTGFAIHIYSINTSMVDAAYCNSDGDFLFVPQQGELVIRTEMGFLELHPGEIGIIQRGIRFSVALRKEEASRGYICEVFDSHFRLPDLGPIGANGLAQPRDFEHPVAAFEDRKCDFTLYQKFAGDIFVAKYQNSPFDVVAWHGNYVPYRYDLGKFCVINSVSFDHLDPSIFTVLTAPTALPGVAACDFVIFPPRWAVQKSTFRPPYYHRNCMSEFMGNIRGRYEAKPEGFLPGGATLHSIMAAHGPDAETFSKASVADVSTPSHMAEDSVAFMFESTYVLRLTDWALNVAPRDVNYSDCWQPLKSNFDPAWKPSEEAEEDGQ
jgi:homogentisate 1,2-dioxygenase